MKAGDLAIWIAYYYTNVVVRVERVECMCLLAESSGAIAETTLEVFVSSLTAGHVAEGGAAEKN